MLLHGLRSLFSAGVGGLMAGLAFAGPAAQPAIEHAPVTVGVRGQTIVLRAHVTNTTQTVKQVMLYYAVSRDAAPYKVAMHDSGADWFTGTIPADLTAGLPQLLYYVEARDASEATTETPWYTIELKSSQPAQATPAPGLSTTATTPDQAEGTKASWRKPALIAGGALLVGGAALALSGGGGGGSGSSDQGTTNSAAGTYNGSVTTCFQPPGGSSSCSARALSIVIDSNGTVSSDSLKEGTHLEGRLSGSNFLLVAPVKENGLTGEIQYLGTVVNTRIAGSIQGSATSADGTGTYSGSFSAMK